MKSTLQFDAPCRHSALRSSQQTVRPRNKCARLNTEDIGMPCKANIRQVGDVAIVDLRGRITLGDGAGIVRETVKDILREGQKRLVLNLGDVSYIDSSGLGELVSAYATGANQGAQIKLLNVQKRVQDLIQLTKLYTVFESFTDEAAAVQSFGAKTASV